MVLPMRLREREISSLSQFNNRVHKELRMFAEGVSIRELSASWYDNGPVIFLQSVKTQRYGVRFSGEPVTLGQSFS